MQTQSSLSIHANTHGLRRRIFSVRKLALLTLLFFVAFLTLGAARPVGAASSVRTRCFPETGYCITGPILNYWEKRGGLSVFGYPITEQRLETVEDRTIQVQWFERDRLEIQADGTITAGRLGARALELQGRRWENQPRQDPLPPDTGGCHYFEATGQVLCEPWLGYWVNNGGLERFGYPISSLRLELIEGRAYTVQYFERRRIEHHPEYAGTPYEYLYGLLGREVLEVQNLPACQGPPRDVQFGLEDRIGYAGFRSTLQCPSISYANVPAAFQQFSGGVMIWLDLGEAGRKIYVLRYPRHGMDNFSYAVYDDTYQEGDPPIDEQPPEVPPRSPIKPSVPQRGFGKVWAAGEREYLGYAIFQEQAEQANVQFFGLGGMALRLLFSGQIAVFGPNYSHAQLWSS